MQEIKISLPFIDESILNLQYPKSPPIIEFDNRYSTNCFFIVPVSFKEPFGIKQGTGKNKDEIYQSHATLLERGDTFYNNTLAYTNWLEFLKLDNAMCIEVHFANVNKFNENTKKFDEGVVRFHLYEPSTDKTKIELASRYSCSAFEFLHILKFGYDFN